jgi:L-seryl-tRNA(Ser) seleniumtransferase
MKASIAPLLKRIPAVSLLVEQQEFKRLLKDHSRPFLVRVVREVLDEIRRAILEGGEPDMAPPEIWRAVERKLNERSVRSLKRVVNGTGVIVHTNLGRSLLAREALEAVSEVAAHYSNLEFDLKVGERGSRYTHVEEILKELTGAEAALVVNNNAAAVLLALNTLARGREVIVSRGQLIEIGGSFRIPEVMTRSGAVLREVGTTNKTRLQDYEAAVSEHTALLLKVHTSNYRILGFTAEVALEDLVALGRRTNLPVMEDLGSGCFVDVSPFGLEKEPTVQEVIRAGADVVTFSGDKLLGGPQAGIIVGRKSYIQSLRSNPLNRALRIDKMTLAALEATLRLYQNEELALKEIPTLSAIASSPAELKAKARALLRRLTRRPAPALSVEIIPCVSQVGGGALPLAELPSYALAFTSEKESAAELERRFRFYFPPIIGRIEKERFLLDVRTLQKEDFPFIVRCCREGSL